MTLLKRISLFVMLLCFTTSVSHAQRQTDVLDRGLVAVQTDGGVYCSWRILGEEYYDVTYNLYRDGVKLNDVPLNVSNFVDTGGSAGSKYTVAAVVRGQEQAQSKTATVWGQNYLEIQMDHGALTSTYVPNDACCADVDGDGELEILLKFDNTSDSGSSYMPGGYNGEYAIVEVYKLDGTKLWWLDFGPNMGDFQNNENNIVAYDWDQDGRAEAVMRAADGTVIHAADGQEYVIGDPTKNYRSPKGGGGTNWFMHEGDEFLVYMNGATGVPYQVMEYPLKRLEAGETDLNAAWGDGYGHRSTKHFFGAPYLDGRHPSIFLARGIYTRHKMIALDVDPATHELTERWRWSCNNSSSPWYGQGYHNYAVADVDWDGRDEICFGSMVIDDNGHGLSTTGLGHGDAQHHGDFNPYIHGHEIYACNEDEPNNNFRDATTSKIYYRSTGTNDDGRCMAGNFTNDYPGAIGLSSRDEPISCVTNGHIPGLTKATANVTQNMRIYWDGDLLEESFDYTDGKNTTGGIYKYKVGLIEKLAGSMTNNDTKGTPCYQGDLLGDWREEVIMRTRDNNIRIYTTTIPTEWRNYTLWHDMQYRQAMVWQMCGYNQPPHVSYFLGELEGITQAPPPLTMTGREEVKNGGTIGNYPGEGMGRQLIACEPNDMEINIDWGGNPEVFIDNAPTWVQGHDDNDNITTTVYTHTVDGGVFINNTRIVKQGDGVLKLGSSPAKSRHSHTGPTEVWAGTLSVDYGFEFSHVWLNRFAVLETKPMTPDTVEMTEYFNGYTPFDNGIEASYGSVIRPGGVGGFGTIATNELKLGFGSVLEIDLKAKDDGSQIYCDAFGVDTLQIEKKDWEYGPQYNAPVIRITPHFYEGQSQLPEGRYVILQAQKVKGSIDDLIVEGLEGTKHYLDYETTSYGFTTVWLVIGKTRSPETVAWDGGTDGMWDFSNTANFRLPGGQQDVFVTGDDVVFGDDASQTEVTVDGDVTPGSILFCNETKDYTLSGEGSIVGKASLRKTGAGNLTVTNTNRLNGGVFVEGGTLTVSALANADGADYGALGGVRNGITLSNGGVLSVTNTTVCSQAIEIGEGGGTISVAQGRTLTAGSIAQTAKSFMRKEGGGTLTLDGVFGVDTLFVDKGTVLGSENSNNYHLYPSVIVLNSGALKDPDNMYSYSSNTATVVVPAGAKASWTLDSRCDYKGKLLGSGELTVNVTSVRCNMEGDWSQFAGILNFQNTKTGSYAPSLQWNNPYGLGKATVKGDFENNGKSVTIGRLSDKVSITGSGRTTVKHLELKTSKSRSGLLTPSITLAGTLYVSDSITVTHTGYDLKLGDEIILWTAGDYMGNPNLVIRLPELPEGLYWDTTGLLKKQGVLKVTDTQTGIRRVQVETGDDRIYTLSGMSAEKPLKKGIYIKNGKKLIIK